jgi:gamma-glutamyltranspeptidase/glutathione hydrolase
LAPAVEYAREGFPVSPVVAHYWAAAARIYGKFNDDEAFHSWFETFTPGGNVPHAGQIWTSLAHAATLEEIGATQGESFYRGGLAQKIAEFSQQHGGFLTKQDLTDYQCEWEQPLCVNYRGVDVWQMPPPTQGLVALMALGILDGLEPTAHNQMEALKLAFVRGMESITDPKYMRVGAQELLAPAFLQKMRASIGEEAAQPTLFPTGGTGTVYLTTADGEGNMVSFIQSNYMGFGSGMVVPGTGIALQNRGADFSLDAAHANALAGSKRVYHTIIPGFLTKNGAAYGAYGIMGGYMQPQAHVQVISNLLDGGMNPQEALDAPRWQWTKGKHFLAEPHFCPNVLESLRNRGHEIEQVQSTGSFGRGQIILRDENGVLCGGTENRANGMVAAW